MRIEKEISPDYQFCLPSTIDFVKYKGKYIVIAREEGNWIVLDNTYQLSFFKALQDNCLNKALALSECSMEDAEWVVTQLVARHFEDSPKYQNLTPVMQLYLTNSCNMRCPHCYMNAGVPDENELSTDEIKSILKAYKDNQGVDVKLTGGEIALRKDLLEITKYGFDLGLHMELLTNGTLWTKEVIATIAPYISVVQISIDGYDEKENSKIRGKGSFEKALFAVHEFALAGVNVHIAITANYSTKLSAKVDKYVNFATHLKQKYKDYNLDVFIATGLLPGRYGKLTKKEADEYTTITQNIYSKFRGCDNFADNGFIERHKDGSILDNCSYGFPTIASNGDVYMCPIISAVNVVANIRTTPLSEIMEICNHAHQLSQTGNLEPCNHCELKAICGGDCRIRYFEHLRQSDISKVCAPINRICNQDIKEKFYDLMVRTNQEIFH